VERHLRRLGDGAAQQPERDEHRERRAFADGLGRLPEDRGKVERADLLDEDEECEHEGRVSDRVHDEGLLARLDGRLPLVPVVDEQVRGEADQAPAGQEQEQVPRHHEQEHREDEQRLVPVVAPLLLVPVHVTDRVGEDEEADAADDEHHEDGQRVDQNLGADAKVACREPRPGGGELGALLRLAAEQVEEDRERADEGEERGP
jgi:hypothetical protein